MAYTVPPTWVTGHIVTAAELNTYLNANLAALKITAEEIISTARLANGAVTNDKIYTGTIEGSKLAWKTITDDKIADGTISSAKLANAYLLVTGKAADSDKLDGLDSSAFLPVAQRVYAGKISSTGTLTPPSGTTGRSANNISKGRFRITHNLGTTAYVIMSSGDVSFTYYADLTSSTVDIFVVEFNPAPQFVDKALSFMIRMI